MKHIITLIAACALLVFTTEHVDGRNPSPARLRMRKAGRARRKKTTRASANAPRPANSDIHARRDSAELHATLKANNPGLKRDFLISAHPATVLNMPNGEEVALWQTKQFAKYNFRMSIDRVGGNLDNKETRNTLNTVMYRIRNSMIHPAFLAWLKSKVGEEQAMRHYNRFRREIKTQTVIVEKKEGGKKASAMAVGKHIIKFFVNPRKHKALTHTGTRYSTLGHELQHEYGYSHDISSVHALLKQHQLVMTLGFFCFVIPCLKGL